MDNDQLFYNDLFRLGGLNSIRGFNERNFFASWYLTGTLEYRYLFDNDSQLFFFLDSSGLGYDIQDQKYRDHPFGFGGGFTLSTRAGLLHIIYALGKSSGQPLGLNYSKIHIGYSNRF
jgi:translocation and assembly module TamA